MNLEGGVCIEKSIPRGRGGGVCIEKSIRGGGVELSDQSLDPDVPTLASQDKLKVSPKGLPFVIRRFFHESGDLGFPTALLDSLGCEATAGFGKNMGNGFISLKGAAPPHCLCIESIELRPIST